MTLLEIERLRVELQKAWTLECQEGDRFDRAQGRRNHEIANEAYGRMLEHRARREPLEEELTARLEALREEQPEVFDRWIDLHLRCLREAGARAVQKKRDTPSRIHVGVQARVEEWEAFRRGERGVVLYTWVEFDTELLEAVLRAFT